MKNQPRLTFMINKNEQRGSVGTRRCGGSWKGEGGRESLPCSAALLAKSFGRRLVIAWGLSVAGATMVCALGLLPLVALALRRVARV